MTQLALHVSPDPATAKTAARLQSLLMPGEIVLHGAHIHFLSYAKPMVVGLIGLVSTLTGLLLPAMDGWIVFGLFLLTIALIGAVTTGLRNWSTQMAITNRRVILRTGIIARDTADIPLSKIDLVMMEQGIIERLFGCGSVIIRTVGEMTTTFASISTPTTMRNAVLGAMEAAGKPVAPVPDTKSA